MEKRDGFEEWIHQRMRLFSPPAAIDVIASREQVRANILAGRSTSLAWSEDRPVSRSKMLALVAMLVAAVGLAVLLQRTGLPQRAAGSAPSPGNDLRPQAQAPRPNLEVSVPPSNSAARLQFEVAAIRSEATPLTYVRIQAEGYGFTSEGTTLAALIRYAYNVSSFQVLGGPEWIQDRNFQFRIQAKAEMPASTDQFRQMLQSLLAERFKLRVVHQSKQGQGYLLQLDKNGPKFRKTEDLGPQGCYPFPAKCVRTTMAGFAEYLSTVVLRMPVVDRTSLPGLFDLAVEWQPDSSQFGGNGGVGFFAGSPSSPSLFTAVKEQLGLRLEPAVVPIEMLSIEQAKLPTEN
jgi:uncharacterized protein (TIGR03435 family)